MQDNPFVLGFTALVGRGIIGADIGHIQLPVYSAGAIDIIGHGRLLGFRLLYRAGNHDKADKGIAVILICIWIIWCNIHIDCSGFRQCDILKCQHACVAAGITEFLRSTLIDLHLCHTSQRI